MWKWILVKSACGTEVDFLNKFNYIIYLKEANIPIKIQNSNTKIFKIYVLKFSKYLLKGQTNWLYLLVYDNIQYLDE